MDKFFESTQRRQRPKQQDGDLAGKGEGPSRDEVAEEGKKRALPRGVVLGPDGKPCRSCTSVSAWMKMANAESSSTKGKAATSTATDTISASESEPTLPSHCPPDVETLGRSTWTFLHTLSASYPSRATPTQQTEMTQFLGLFGKLYPCWHCAQDFRDWMGKKGNEPRVAGREELGKWMCEAHNDVNRKLGKKVFDCDLWKERWRDGPADGSCG